MVDCFNQIAEDSECRVVVFSGAGKIFTSGKHCLDTLFLQHLTQFDQLLVSFAGDLLIGQTVHMKMHS